MQKKNAHSLLRKCALLLCAVLLLPLFACEYKPENLQGSTSSKEFPASTTLAPLPEETNTLVLYQDPREQNAKLIMKAIITFMGQYPDVKIDYRTFPDVSPEDYMKAMGTDLMAGDGPDVVFWHAGFGEFPDVYKMIEAGVFVDLNPFIDADLTFPWEDLNKTVLNAGVFGTNRYFIPLDYSASMFVTTQENMDVFGLSFAEGMSLDDFAVQLKKFQMFAEEDRNLFLFPGDGYGASVMLDSGLSVLDYTNKTVSVRSKEFRQVMELCAAVNGLDRGQDYLRTDKQVIAMRENQLLLVTTGSVQFPRIYSGLAPAQTPVIIPFPNLLGTKAIARFGFTVAIPKTSANQQNAYNFIKILLSEREQGRFTGPLMVPVSYAGIENIQSVFLKAGNFISEGIEYILPAQEVMDDYNRMLIDVELAPAVDISVWVQVYTIMQPYFDGTRSYESCVDELENALRLYISE